MFQLAKVAVTCTAAWCPCCGIKAAQLARGERTEILCRLFGCCTMLFHLRMPISTCRFYHICSGALWSALTRGSSEMNSSGHLEPISRLVSTFRGCLFLRSKVEAAHVGVKASGLGFERWPRRCPDPSRVVESILVLLRRQVIFLESRFTAEHRHRHSRCMPESEQTVYVKRSMRTVRILSGSRRSGL